MEEPRLKAELRAKAILRQAQAAGAMGMVLRRGDADAGSINVVLRNQDGGLSVLSPTRAPDGTAAWIRGTGPEPVDQATTDAYLDRQAKRDPDLWILEIEGPRPAATFEGKIL